MAIQNSDSFYDKESVQYSRKRYEGPLVSYTQFLFRKRLSLYLQMIKSAFPKDRPISMLEIGCADGIIMQRTLAAYPDAIKKIVGIDISDMMIETAKAKFTDPKMEFFLRGNERKEIYDVVIELGVHMENLDKEMAHVKSLVAENGFFIFSAAGRGSLHAKFKLQNAPYAKDYKEYSETEVTLSKYFEIVEARAYGLFVPKLWAVPAIGRVLQPVVDMLFRHITPSLFHEKIYLLKNKSTS